LRNHALGDWTAAVEDIPTWLALGARCYWDTRRIVLDYDTLRFSRYKIRWILLHEIAHALAGESAGHGPQWQRKARSLGVPIFDIEEHASRDRQEQAARQSS
jgi:hypothetical protein